MEEQKFIEKEVGHLEKQLESVESVHKPGFDKSKLILPVSILIAAFMISGTLMYTRASSNRNAGSAVLGQQVPQAGAKVNVSADDDPFLGNEKAKVTVVEFSDFQCPFCRSFWRDSLPQIKKEYIGIGKIKFVYRDFPLSFHPGAEPAAEGASCAREQGKFWEFHDKIFEEQDKRGQGTIQFTASDVKKWAGQVGLDVAKFNQCLDSEKYKEEVAKDVADGTAAGVSGTPTTFINGRSLVGAQPFSAFKALIDEELKK